MLPPEQAEGPLRLPLQGVRVVEFAHMVMGPTCGLVLADLGADVIKVEPLEGDNTRRLTGAAPVSIRSSTEIREVSRLILSTPAEKKS